MPWLFRGSAGFKYLPSPLIRNARKGLEVAVWLVFRV